jgi:hypothetical protein
MKTHIETLLENTPKVRRRIRALGAKTPEEAQALARQRERASAVRDVMAKLKEVKP